MTVLVRIMYQRFNINLNIVECKYKKNILKNRNMLDINLNIVECKLYENYFF